MDKTNGIGAAGEIIRGQFLAENLSRNFTPVPQKICDSATPFADERNKTMTYTENKNLVRFMLHFQ
ncbi:MULTISPECIES: hypothetical protein [Nitrosospira]|uniref:hypothetical protein n=1 Tax=Nitrosospira TaxID=35798 RepID=UPI000943F261|nr:MULTISPECIES: hypothetical protein [Nitrosospira]